jgi:hypothetical protein
LDAGTKNALLLCAAFLTLGVGSKHAAAAVFAVAGACELPLCVWGSERLQIVADEFKHWHPESAALLALTDDTSAWWGTPIFPRFS